MGICRVDRGHGIMAAGPSRHDASARTSPVSQGADHRAGNRSRFPNRRPRPRRPGMSWRDWRLLFPSDTICLSPVVDSMRRSGHSHHDRWTDHSYASSVERPAYDHQCATAADRRTRRPMPFPDGMRRCVQSFCGHSPTQSGWASSAVGVLWFVVTSIRQAASCRLVWWVQGSRVLLILAGGHPRGAPALRAPSTIPGWRNACSAR